MNYNRRNGISQICKPSFQEDTISTFQKKRDKYVNPAHILTEALLQLFKERDEMYKNQKY